LDDKQLGPNRYETRNGTVLKKHVQQSPIRVAWVPGGEHDEWKESSMVPWEAIYVTLPFTH